MYAFGIEPIYMERVEVTNVCHINQQWCAHLYHVQVLLCNCDVESGTAPRIKDLDRRYLPCR